MPLSPRFKRKDYRIISTPNGLYAEYGPPAEELLRKQERYMNSEDYKRGVLEASKELIEGTLPSSRLFKVAFDEEMRLRRKKLLTKKVTKWTGIITSEWSGLPTILELCDTEEEVKKFLAKNPKPLTKAIPIEIETEI